MRGLLFFLLLGNLAFGIDAILATLPPPQAVYFSPEQLADLRFHAKDGAGTGEVLPPAGEGEPSTYRFVVNQKTDNPWDVGFGWSTPKGIGPVRDDVLLVSFEARAVGQGDRGTGQVRVVLRSSAQTSRPALGETCNFGRAWKRFNLAASPDADMAADGMLLTFNLGLREQEIEIRDIRVLNFGQSIPWAHLLQAIGASPWRTGRKIAGRALEPRLLWEMKAFDGLEVTPPDFSPNGAWKATYAIFHCQGYLLFGSSNRGLLHLERIPQDDGTFLLKATQTVRLDYAMSQVTEAVARCRTNALGTPLSWTVSSRFFSPEGEEIPDLSTTEEGAPPTGLESSALDWGLFEAVQRLDPRGAPPAFSMIEGFDLVKTDQRLVVRDEEEVLLGTTALRLRRIDQLGNGVLPISYWLDGKGRLQIVVTHNRAYILDPEATEKYERYSKEQTERQQRVERRMQETEAQP